MLRHLPLILMVAMTGCTGSMTGTSQSTAPTVFPVALYLGVEDSGAKYGAPVAVAGAGPMAYSITDATIASASGDDATVEVAALRVGATDVVAKNTVGQAMVHVTVTTYTACSRNLSVTWPVMARVTTPSTPARRARSLKVRRSP